jgi:hypothetical protein
VKFPVSVVRSFADVQKVLEWLTTRDFLQLAAGGEKYMDSGSNVLTFAGSADSQIKTVVHRLGKTPAQVLLTIGDSSASWMTMSAFNRTASTFQVMGHDIDSAARTGSADFHWVAIV